MRSGEIISKPFAIIRGMVCDRNLFYLVMVYIIM